MVLILVGENGNPLILGRLFRALCLFNSLETPGWGVFLCFPSFLPCTRPGQLAHKANQISKALSSVVGGKGLLACKRLLVFQVHPDELSSTMSSQQSAASSKGFSKGCAQSPAPCPTPAPAASSSCCGCCGSDGGCCGSSGCGCFPRRRRRQRRSGCCSCCGGGNQSSSNVQSQGCCGGC